MWLLVGFACLLAPVPGAVQTPFAPTGAYAGHWGVDLAAEMGTAVRAPVGGTVSFAGSVAGMLTVTIVSGEMKVSVSYLSSVGVSRGDEVQAGEVVGQSGVAHGGDALHLSVRLHGQYVDPAPFLACRFGPISDALRLVPYPDRSANRIAGRNL